MKENFQISVGQLAKRNFLEPTFARCAKSGGAHQCRTVLRLKFFILEQEILALVNDKKADLSAEILNGYSEVLNLELDEIEIIKALIDEYVPS